MRTCCKTQQCNVVMPIILSRNKIIQTPRPIKTNHRFNYKVSPEIYWPHFKACKLAFGPLWGLPLLIAWFIAQFMEAGGGGAATKRHLPSIRMKSLMSFSFFFYFRYFYTSSLITLNQKKKKAAGKIELAKNAWGHGRLWFPGAICNFVQITLGCLG